MESAFILQAIDTVSKAILANEAEIESLDRAIGDGDHFINIRRGCAAITGMRDELPQQAAEAALQRIGMKLLATIGGASGPLIGSFFISMAKAAKEHGAETLPQIAAAFATGVDAIRQRGKADVGEKTMLDVLIPVSRTFTRLAAQGVARTTLFDALRHEADQGLQSTRDMMATKGRAAFLGARAVGHLDPGAKSCQVMIRAICDLAAAGTQGEAHEEIHQPDR
ncbi:PTS-dependent dihydroxyacetone kinase, ADP-binding subunit DhaL [mine drainage metagenome]|uniref:PTS-dependent dihydroxyacetone kinase, ADP-binding subunit DhaL n=1 Tax=mine drainage metagenome TaxID=410659 RepID=A0A1J5QIK3_9ZZZZ